MPSKAYEALKSNLTDIHRLLEIHQATGGSGPGRKYGLEVLNKSAIVLITAIWEAYCEDIAAEGLKHLVDNLSKSDNLTKELKKQIAGELKANDNNLDVWKLADDGWKKILQDRFGQLSEKRNRKLNTPKHAQIDELFRHTLGISKISSSWTWKRVSASQSRTKLDKFVELRGAIAHRGKSSDSVKLSQVREYLSLLEKITAKTGGRVNKHVKDMTGKPLWTIQRKKSKKISRSVVSR